MFDHISAIAQAIASAKSSRAGRHHFHDGKTLFPNRLLDHPIQLDRIVHGSPGNEAGACCFSQSADIEWIFNIAKWRGAGFVIERRGRRYLPAGHAVNIIIEQHHSDVDIASRRMNIMIAANRGGIAIASNDDDRHFWLHHFHARGKSNRPAVSRVQRIEIHIARQSAGTANARHHTNFIIRQPNPIDRPQHGFQHNAIAAARTPDQRQFI